MFIPNKQKAKRNIRYNLNALHTLSASTTLNKIIVGISLLGEGSILETCPDRTTLFQKKHKICVHKNLENVQHAELYAICMNYLFYQHNV